jgi:CRISPR-associated protein Cas2
MFIIVSYDIVSNRKRYRVAKILKNYGVRVQKSVFECQIDDRQYLKMREEIEKNIDHELDSVRYYFLCSRCVGNVEVSGWGTVSYDDENVIIV